MLVYSMRIMSLLLGCVLCVAAIYLPRVPFIELDLNQGTNGYLLIQFHIFATGLAAVLMQIRREWAVAPTILIIVINTYLSIDVLIEQNVALFCVHALTVCSFSSLFSGAAENPTYIDDTEVESSEQIFADPAERIGPNFGKILTEGHFLGKATEYSKFSLLIGAGLLLAAPLLAYDQLLGNAFFMVRTFSIRMC